MPYYVDKVWSAHIALLTTALRSGLYTEAPMVTPRQRLLRAKPGAVDLWSACGIAMEVIRVNQKAAGVDIVVWTPDITNAAMIAAGAYSCSYGTYYIGATNPQSIDYKCWGTLGSSGLFYYNFTGEQAQELFERFSYPFPQVSTPAVPWSGEQTFAQIATWLESLPGA